jgi:NAD(P)H dehydrogenase (quinone)
MDVRVMVGQYQLTSIERKSNMNVLWVYAHPESRSLNATLRDVGTEALRQAGHGVTLSDLYAMSWKAPLDRGDFGDLPHAPTELSRASKWAQRAGTVSDDIRVEQHKLVAADTLVLQFPLWWYATPAILKGWIDRVFAKGFAYGIRDPADPTRTLRYGDGPLRGKRAQVITTTGSPAAAMGPRGINGQLDQVLFPLLHGTLWYVGMEVLPPLAVHGADRLTASDYAEALDRVRERMTRLQEVEPLAYRHQNRGDYDRDLVLREHLSPGQRGIGVHTDGTFVAEACA